MPIGSSGDREPPSLFHPEPLYIRTRLRCTFPKNEDANKRMKFVRCCKAQL